MRRVNHTTVTHGGYLYVFGGREMLAQTHAGDVGSYVLGVHRYDFRRMVWENVQEKDRSQAVRYTSSSILEGRAEKPSVDGEEGIKKGRAAFCTPGARGDHSAVVVDEWMVVYGGRKGSNTSAGEVVYDDMFAFNLRSHLWRDVKHEKGCGPGCVFGHAVALRSSTVKEMFVVGGVHLQPLDKLVFGFDFRSNRWRSFPPPTGVNPQMIHGVEIALVEHTSPSREMLLIIGLDENDSPLVTRTTTTFPLHALDVTTGVWTKLLTHPSPSSSIPFRMCELRQAFSGAGFWNAGSCFNQYSFQWHFVVRAAVDDATDELVPTLAVDAMTPSSVSAAEKRSSNPYGIRGPRNISLLASLPRLLMFTFSAKECTWSMSAVTDPLVSIAAKRAMELSPSSDVAPSHQAQLRHRHLATTDPAKVLLESGVLGGHQCANPEKTTPVETTPMLAAMMGTDWRIQNTIHGSRQRLMIQIPTTTPRPQGRLNVAEGKREECDGVQLLEAEEQLITVAKPYYSGEPFRRAPQSKSERKYALVNLIQPGQSEGTLVAVGGCEEMSDRVFAQIVGEGFGAGLLPFQSTPRIPLKPERVGGHVSSKSLRQSPDDGFQPFLVPKKPSLQATHRVGSTGLGGRLERVVAKSGKHTAQPTQLIRNETQAASFLASTYKFERRWIEDEKRLTVEMVEGMRSLARRQPLPLSPRNHQPPSLPDPFPFLFQPSVLEKSTNANVH